MYFLFLLSLFANTNRFCTAKSPSAAPLHVVFVVVDDLGYHDVSFHGSEIATPFMDSLAKEGVHFDNYYGHMICTPSRAALFTGRYASHTGLQHSFITNGQNVGLPLKFRTMADHLSDLGYETHAIGKYHLGFQSPEYHPLSRGFSTFFGYLGGGEDYYTHVTSGFVDLQHNRSCALGHNGTYSAQLFTDKALDVVRSYATSHPSLQDRQSHPLFLYLAYQSVHAPLEAPDDYIQHYDFLVNASRRTMAGMTSLLDDQLSRLAKGIQSDTDLWKNTLLVVVADNGGPPYVANSNWPMRGGKWTLWEGGTHLVALAFHSSLIPAKRFAGLAHHVDWLPTLLEAAGGDVENDVDGVSLWRWLVSDEAVVEGPRHSVLLNVDQTNLIDDNDPDGWAGYAGLVTRDDGGAGQWKLVLGNPGVPDSWCWPDEIDESNDVSGPGLAGVTWRQAHASPMPDPAYVTCRNNASIPANRTGPLLFDLLNDPIESVDLAAVHPEKVQELMDILNGYIASAVDPLNETPDQRQIDADATRAARAAGCWVPWQPGKPQM